MAVVMTGPGHECWDRAASSRSLGVCILATTAFARCRSSVLCRFALLASLPSMPVVKHMLKHGGTGGGRWAGPAKKAGKAAAIGERSHAATAGDPPRAAKNFFTLPAAWFAPQGGRARTGLGFVSPARPPPPARPQVAGKAAGNRGRACCFDGSFAGRGRKREKKLLPAEVDGSRRPPGDAEIQTSWREVDN